MSFVEAELAARCLKCVRRPATNRDSIDTRRAALVTLNYW
jgi:hypothetical protein